MSKSTQQPRTIAARVQVFASDDRYVFSVDPTQTRRMLAEGQAVRRCSGRTLRALTLLNPPVDERETRTNANWHGGTSLVTTRVEELRENGVRVARLIQHKPLPRADSDADLFIRRIYRAAVLENIAQ